VPHAAASELAPAARQPQPPSSIVHTPLSQVLVVHGVFSGLIGCVHWPVVGSQVPFSSHSLWAAQSRSVPLQVPAMQVSEVVQASPSSQAGPVRGAQVPSAGEHALHAPHATGVPLQVPAVQVSEVVQASPSSQAGPVRGAQVPSVGAPAAMEQASQGAPVQAVAQQTPSTQNMLAQSEGAVHGVPFAGRSVAWKT
jgi:hypothetical protein